MRPCQRAQCSKCGKNVGVFGVRGLGLSLKFHEARCGGIPAEPQPEQLAPPPFLPHVDRQVDMAVLKLEDQARTLFLPGTEVRKIMQEHPDLGREMLNLIIVTWRPGAGGNAPLRALLARGPGGLGQKTPCQNLYKSGPICCFPCKR